MKIDSLLAWSIADAGPTAADLEAAGYSGAWTVEGPRDPVQGDSERWQAVMADIKAI